MTVRLSVSLPDEVHADLKRIADASHISAASVVRAVLADLLPRMTSVLDHIGNTPPDAVGPMVDEIDAWTLSLRRLLHDAPEVMGEFRTLLDQQENGGDET